MAVFFVEAVEIENHYRRKISYFRILPSRPPYQLFPVAQCATVNQAISSFALFISFLR